MSALPDDESGSRESSVSWEGDETGSMHPAEAAAEGVVRLDGEKRDESGKQDGDEGPTEDAEEEECGFCLFMKAGPCGKRFSLWEDCVDSAEKSGDNIVERCWEMTNLLKHCMEENPEYYAPVLQAEKSLQEEATVAAAAAAAAEAEVGESHQVTKEETSEEELDMVSKA